IKMDADWRTDAVEMTAEKAITPTSYHLFGRCARWECCGTGIFVPAQLFTKAVSAKPILATPKASLTTANDYYGLKRLAKSEAETPQGIMRLADKIIEDSLPQPAKLDSKKKEGLTYAERRRCNSVDPDAYRWRVPFNRVETPHEARKRRPPGWTDCRF